MHIPDGFISGPIAITSGVVALAAVELSAWRASRQLEKQPHIVPLLATTGAFVFAAQMLNFPIGGGTSGHFLGAAAVAALLGPWNACMVMALVLTIQCLLFSDGGLTALGANVVNMGIVASFSGYVVMRLIRAVSPPGRGGYLLAAALGSWISVVCASAACALELAVSGTSPLALVMPAMVGTHAVIAVGEALITTAVLSAVFAARPDILPAWSRVAQPAGARSAARNIWPIAVGGTLTAILLAFAISPFASSAPDGLERIATQQQFVERPMADVSWTHGLFTDYSVPGVGNERASTGLAGVLGTAAIFAVGFGVVKLLVRPGRKREK